MAAQFFLFIPFLIAAAPPQTGSFGKQPLYFEPNLGQTDPSVRFLARGSGFMAWITDHEITLRHGRSGETTRISFAPEAKQARATKGIDKQIGTSAYFIGKDERKWVRNVPSFAKALVEEAYPGIDVVFYEGKGKHALEYDFIVKPGADPSQISIDFDPVQKPRRDALGVISLNSGNWTHEIPMVHQGFKQVAYKSNFDGRSLRFNMGEYDRAETLVIDPAIAFSTYLGGTEQDRIHGVAVDPTSAAYVTGLTSSADFPSVNPGATTVAPKAFNVFATKFGAAPVQNVYPRVYSIYFGTNEVLQLDNCKIAVDRTGAAFIATTNQTLLMPVRNAAQGGWNGGQDGWVGKISAMPGSAGYDFEYGTYLGGSGNDAISGIAVDNDGAAYVTGGTISPNFPVLNSPQTSGSAYIVKIAARPRNGSTVFHYVYSLRYGVDATAPTAIAVDTSGAAYITGSTGSRDLPVVRAFQPTSTFPAGESTGFVAKFSGTADTATGVYNLVYSTFLGGSSRDSASAIAVDPAGNAYVAGLLASKDFPLVRPMNAYAKAFAFVAKIGAQPNNSGVHPLLFSSGLPAAYDPRSIDLDAAGSVYVGANVFSRPLPRLVAPAQIFDTSTSQFSGYVVKLSIPETGDATVLYSTAAGPGLNSLAVDAAGKAFVAGDAIDRQVPVVLGVASSTPNRPDDGYLMVLSNGPSPFTVVIQSNRSDTPFQISGPAACQPGTYLSPAAFSWPSGTTCTVQPTTLLQEAFSRDQFRNWEDNSSTVATRTITATAQSQTYLLNYDRYWRVVINQTEGSVTPAPVSFLPEGSINTITATPPIGGVFFRWENGPFVGRATSPVITTPPLDGPVELTARFVPAYTAQPPMQFLPLTPCRLADTRFAEGPTIAGKTVREFTVTGKCGVPLNATAFSLNVTVVPKGPLGFLTLFPTGQAQPMVSTLNALDGRIKANAAIIRAGTGGKVSIYVTDDTDVVLDINGVFMPPGALTLAYYPVTPCRVLDTRTSGGAPRLAALATRSIDVRASSCGIPTSARAYALNATVIPTARLGYLRIQPTGSPVTQTSTLNALTGTIVANQAIVQAGNNGAIDVFATDSTDLILDIHGYFAPAAPGGLNFYPVDPCRSMDTLLTVVLSSSVQWFHNIGLSCPTVPAAARAYSINVTAVPTLGPLDTRRTPALGYLTIIPGDLSNSDVWRRVSLLNALDGAIASNAAIIEGNPDTIGILATDTARVLIDVNGFFAQ